MYLPRKCWRLDDAQLGSGLSPEPKKRTISSTGRG